MEEIIVATNNLGKIKEIKEILKDVTLLTMKEVGIMIEIEENELTFEKNALKKAKEIARLTQKTCIADDSGLMVDELDGFPGVKTKRFLEEEATDEERNNYLLEKLKGLPKQRRKAKVVTCIALANEQEEIVLKGEVQGWIATEKRGDNGFGFDEIVELENGKTLAELLPEEKNEISSRRLALEKLRLYLEQRDRK